MSFSVPTFAEGNDRQIPKPAVANSSYDKAEAAVLKGLEYLQKQQKEDGSWERPGDPPAITALKPWLITRGRINFWRFGCT